MFIIKSLRNYKYLNCRNLINLLLLFYHNIEKNLNIYRKKLILEMTILLIKFTIHLQLKNNLNYRNYYLNLYLSSQRKPLYHLKQNSCLNHK